MVLGAEEAKLPWNELRGCDAVKDAARSHFLRTCRILSGITATFSQCAIQMKCLKSCGEEHRECTMIVINVRETEILLSNVCFECEYDSDFARIFLFSTVL